VDELDKLRALEREIEQEWWWLMTYAIGVSDPSHP
jgi:hypothetical protein